MDALPPSASAPAPPARPPLVVAPSEIEPRTPEETRLCEKASSFDWLYFGGTLVLDVGSVYLDAFQLKESEQPGVRMIGPGLVGFSVGATIGGTYLALPKCSPTWVPGDPAEGDIRQTAPLALSLALVSSAMAPLLVGIETGPLKLDWSVTERSMRLVTAGAAGFVGALVPYLLPPKTWRAKKELENLRLSGDQNGAFVGYRFRF